MKFIEDSIEQNFFEETRYGWIFHPAGRACAGKIKAYVVRTDDDKSQALSFLKNQMFWSYLFILLLPLIGFELYSLIGHIFPETERSTRFFVSFGTIFIMPCAYRLWYDHRVKDITTGWPSLIVHRTYGEAMDHLFSKNNSTSWALAAIAIALLIIECLIIAHSEC
ncbi:MAG: hypothetical protein JXR40_10685 [Pontiellaceae bacterium]|nr:hypothetical protein [Pontiellaceae bacterium]